MKPERHYDSFGDEIAIGDEVVFCHYYEGAPLLRGNIVAFRKEWFYVDCSKMYFGSRVRASYKRCCKIGE